MRRPVVSLVLAAGLLLALAAPVLALDTGTSGAATLPDRFESKQGYLLLREEFPKESTEPVEIAVAGDVGTPAVEGALARLEQELARRPIFGEPTVEANEAGTVARVTVPIAGNPDGERAIEAVRELRSEAVPRAFAGVDAEVYVGGDTAEELDYHDTVNFWLPLVLLFVLGLSFLLLTLAFRSIVVPATAIGMNLLSVGAAYGLLVLVFQEGIGNELLGLREAETIDAWVPLFLFAVLFGLSMDYQVFLLSRIRERYMQTGDNDAADRLRHRLDRPPHHRRRADHHRRLLGLRDGRHDRLPADGLRRRRRAPDRRDDRPLRPRPGNDEAPGRAQLVPALVAHLAPRRPRRGRRAAADGRASPMPGES